VHTTIQKRKRHNTHIASQAATVAAAAMLSQTERAYRL